VSTSATRRLQVLVLGDPRTSDVFPCAQSWTSWKAHFYSSLANCVLQILLAAEVFGPPIIMIALEDSFTF
jgi:hypothetical protein